MRNRLAYLPYCLAALFGTQVALAQNVTFAKLSHQNISQITVNQTDLLTGCGFSLIGSQFGPDNAYNIRSCDAVDATVRPYPDGAVIDGQTSGTFMSPVGLTTPWLAHQLHFTPDPNNVTRMLFGGQVGPSTYDFATLSLPFDALRDKVSHYRYEGGYVAPFSGFPFAYNQNDDTSKPVFINNVGLYKSWGELIGPDYTMRVTITGTSPDASTGIPRPLRLFFVDHPEVKNVEFSTEPTGACPGPTHLCYGEKVNFTGHVEVFDTDPSIFGYTTFETEYSDYHQIGRPEDGGWSANTAQDATGFLNYGPYTTAVLPGAHTAVWRMQTDDVTSNSASLVYIDVYDATTSTVLASREIYRNEFKVANKYQNFSLPFTSTVFHSHEFRTVWRANGKIVQDKVVIKN